jgi:hypothetical protein
MKKPLFAVPTFSVLAIALAFLASRPARVYAGPEDAAGANARRSGVAQTLFGFTPFPYAYTPEAVTKTHVRELFDIARRDRYAFVVWFLAIDYDELYAKMPPGSDVMKLWKNIGLLDGEAHSKPALEIWKASVEKSPGERYGK